VKKEEREGRWQTKMKEERGRKVMEDDGTWSRWPRDETELPQGAKWTQFTTLTTMSANTTHKQKSSLC
jgi:hypothetical protein